MQQQNIQKNTRTSFTLFCLVALLVLSLVTPAFALTVSPAKYNVLGDEPLAKTFTVRNDASQETTVTIGFEGELAAYAQANPTLLSLDAGASQEVTIIFAPPPLTPGKHELPIVFRTSASQGQVGAAAEIVPKLFITKPYPESYLEYGFGVQDANDPLKVTLLIENLGEKETTITPRLALADIRQTQESILIAPKSSRKANYDISFSQKGTHKVILALSSTNNPQVNDQELTKIIHVGKPIFRLGNSSTERTEQGIETLSIPLTHDWNVPLPVTVRASILNGSQKLLELPMQEVTLAASDTLTFFWEPPASRMYVLEFDIVGEFFGTSMEKSFVSLEESRIQGSTIALVTALIVLVAVLGFTLWRITIRK